MHEGPRSSVKVCTRQQHGWPGPCPVDFAIQAEADGLIFAWPFAHFRQYYSGGQHCLDTSLSNIFLFIFRPKNKIYFSAIFILRPKK